MTRMQSIAPPRRQEGLHSTPTQPVDVSVILIGINAKQFVVDCLDSLLGADWQGQRYEALYVDNGSSDDTLQTLERDYPWARCIDNGQNLGFCPAANQAAKTCHARYYYFINDDTLVLEDAVARLVSYLDANPEVGTVGSRLLYPDHREQYSGRRFPTLLSSFMGRRSPLTRLFPNAPWVRHYLCKDQLERGEPFEVDWVSAAGQLVRPADFWAIGGFAEDYYYWHEAIFCSRLQSTGKKVVLHPGSLVIHYEGFGSGPRSYASQKFHIKDFHRGAYRCYCQYHKLTGWHPAKLFIGTLLAARASLLLCAAKLRSLFASSPTSPSA